MGQGIFDAVVGADETALNATVAAFYAAVPSLFTQSFNVGQAGITTIDVVFAVAPTISLTAPSKFHDEARAFITPLVPADRVEAEVLRLTAGTLTVQCASVNCTLNGGKAPIPVVASASSAGVVSVQQDAQGNSVVTLQVDNLTVAVPNEPDLTAILNQFLAPMLITYLNTSILGPFKLPVLALEGVTFVAPTITDDTTPGGNHLIVGYTGIQPVTLPDPGSVEWPAGTVFIGVDAAAIDAVATNVLPNKSDSGCFDPPNLDWNYQVSFGPQIQIQPGAGNSVTIAMSVNGGAGFEYHTPNWLPNIGFSASISGSCSATANVVIDPDGNGQSIGVQITEVGGFDLSLGISGIPDWLMSIFSPLIDPLLNIIGAAASAVLQNFTIHVFTLQPISLSFAGLPAYQLVLQNLALNQIAGPGGVPLLSVTALPQFVQAASTKVTKSYTIDGGEPVPLRIIAQGSYLIAR